MYSWQNESLLFSTGLSMQTIAEIISTCKSEEQLQQELKNKGEKYLDRYLTMKEYTTLLRSGKQKLPIVIILAGFPGIGKTILAKELALIYGINVVIGGDALRSSLRSFLKKSDNPEFHSSVYNAWKHFGEYSEVNLIKGFESQSIIMNKTVEHLIADRGLRDGESMIVEYLHFLPAQINKELFKHPSVIPIVLKINDRNEYEKRIQSREKYSHLRSPSKRLLDHIDQYLVLQEHQCKEAKKQKIIVVGVDQFELSMDILLTYINQRIKELNELKDIDLKSEFLSKFEKERED
ncbi:MAG: hypothetical protein ACTSXA_03675 [Candidatus Heimdallarchaeota archaeon]